MLRHLPTPIDAAVRDPLDGTPPASLNIGLGGVGPARMRIGFLLFAICYLSLGRPLLAASSPASPGTVATNQTLVSPVPPVLPDASFSVIRVFGALALVLALFLAGVWLFKNWQRLTVQRGRPSRLQLIEIKPLGGKHVLYVVGYQQQRLLLAASPAGVNLVSHLPPAEGGELEPTPATNQSFVQALQQAVQGKS